MDDAHWADRPSLRALLYLAQRLDELPIALLVATRPSEPGAPADLLAELSSHPVSRVIEPSPLSEHAVTTLIRQHAPTADDVFCLACSSVSGGNPFLVDELMRALMDQGVEPDRDAVESIRRLGQESISRAVLLRLAHLPAGAVSLARGVAALGGDCDLGLAAPIAGLRLPEAAALADQLSAADILQRSAALGFVDPMVAAAIATETPAGERVQLHALAARRLHDTGAPAGRTAVHLLAVPPAGEAWIVETLRASARLALAEGAPDVAVRHLERALAEPPVAAERPDVMREFGVARSRAGLSGGAEQLIAAARMVAEPHRRAQLLLDAGRALYWLGRNVAAAAALDEGLAALGDTDDDLASELEAVWVNVATIEGSLRNEGRRRLQRIIAKSPSGNTPGERALLAQVAVARTMLGDPGKEPVELALRAWSDGQLIAEETADGLTPYLVTGVLSVSDELEASLGVLDVARDDARRRGSIMGFASASYARGLPLYLQGRLLDAIADLQAALDARRYGWESSAPAACWLLALCHLVRGDVSAAEAAVTVNADSEKRWRETIGYSLLLSARASVAAARHQHEHALEPALSAGRLLSEQYHVASPAVLAWRSQAALAAAATGDSGRAMTLVEEELELARRTGIPRAIGVALRAEGLIRGGHSGLGRLREASEVLADSPARLEHVRALVEFGAATRRDGSQIAARQPLRDALDLADRGGAVALAERARQELVMAGARPRRTVLTGLDALTAAERRVAALAGDGLTNREIAEALFVTPKTVEYHLRNVFAKLQVGSRAELTSALAAHAAPPT